MQNKLPEGTTATDLVLTVVKILRDKGVVGKFVEFYGSGLKNLSLADRATIANMAPEYGATCGFFPVDEETLKYLKFSGRDNATVELVESYSKEQGLWSSNNIEFTDTVMLDMSTVVPTISGPKRPQDKVLLTEAKSSFEKNFRLNSDCSWIPFNTLHLKLVLLLFCCSNKGYCFLCFEFISTTLPFAL